MATLQAKITDGRKYWYIVESRRVNGKPRPIVLAYLGKANDLLKRIQGLTEGFKVKSYSHGLVTACLKVAHQLDIVSLVNQHIKSKRSYTSKKPIRNNLTAGITFLLGAIGRVCQPTSKMSWYQWAKGTSLEYLLKVNLSKVESQHFWDLMDALPEEAIEEIEVELIKRVMKSYEITSESLFYDTTNFFTFISSTNDRCSIAQRGKSKQKRGDLRQVGLALVVTRKDFIPLLHHTYDGNRNDSVIFHRVIDKIKARMIDLGLDLEKHTLVFDRGNNSKKNLAIIEKLKLHYVGALTPYHHRELIENAKDNYEPVEIGTDKSLMVYRDKRIIWGNTRTVLVYVSKGLKAGQIRGVYQSLARREKQLRELQESLTNSRARLRSEEELKITIENIIKGQFMEGLIDYSLMGHAKGKYNLSFSINQKNLNQLEDRLGFRILMTDRHEWSSKDIVNAYHGQSKVEYAFKNIKNPHHLAVRPQFHWTDQKIKVHFFICILGFLLTTIIQHQIRLKKAFKGNMDNLLDELQQIRLATVLEDSKKPGKVKAVYKLEEMTEQQHIIMNALNIEDFHAKRPRFNGVGVYN